MVVVPSCVRDLVEAVGARWHAERRLTLLLLSVSR
jgi:hypothetical protein